MSEELQENLGGEKSGTTAWSDELFLHLLKFSPGAIMLTSHPEMHPERIEIEYVNRAFESLTNTHAAQIQGKSPLDVFKISEDAGQKQLFIQALLQRKSLRPELNIQLPGGEFIWIHFLLTSFRRGDQTVQLWIQQELSNKRKEELSFGRIQELLGSLFDDSEELVFSLDLNQNRVYSNPAFLHFLGEKLQSISGNSFLNLLETVEDFEVNDAFDASSQGIQQNFLASITGRDKHRSWFNFTATPLLENGLVRAVYFVGRDATQQQLNQRYEIIVQQVLEHFESGKTLRDVLQFVLNIICEKFGWECGEVWLPNQLRNRSRLFAWKYPEGKELGEFLSISLSEEISNDDSDALTTRHGKPLLHKATHLFLQENFPRRKWAEQAGLKTGFSLPVILGDHQVALFAFLTSKEQPVEMNDMIFLVRQLAQRIGVHIERKRVQYDFEQLFELAPDFLCVLDANGRFYKANQQMIRLLGISESELQKHSFVDYVDEEYEESTLDFIHQVKDVLQLSFENSIRGNGKSMLLEWSLAYNPVEGVIYGAAKDITLRVQYNEEIRRGAERFFLFSEAINDAIYEWDNEKDAIAWGDSFRRMFGYEHPEDYTTIEGWSQFLHPSDHDRVKQNLANGMKKQERLWSDEYRYRCADGNYKFILDRGIFLYDDKGNATRMVGAMQDITPLKESEETLIKLNEALQQRARQLQGFNKELEQFAYIVSHDLQEPLRMISSFMQLLQNSQDVEKNEKSEQYIGFAIDGALRMKRLIQDLLTYSRVGTTEEDFLSVDTSLVVNDTLQVYHQTIVNKGAEITVGALPKVKAIQSLLGQIFDNLISNALKYTNQKIPRIEISSYETSTHVVFCIADNGIGIDPKYFEMIYLPFKRLHNKNEYSGTGIGLAVCKKIVDKHNGELWVESAPAHGSKFYFSILK